MPTAKRTPLVVVTGYLGAGKTTLLRHLLPQMGSRGLRGLLLVNEVGEVNVDGALLADSSLEQMELLGGCVCCSMRGDLYGALLDGLAANSCDYVVLETSGVAEPAEILEAASGPGVRERVEVTDVVTVMDAANLQMQLSHGPLARLQAAYASVIVVNKVSDVSEGELASALWKIESFSPGTPVVKASKGMVDVSEVLGRTLGWIQTGSLPPVAPPMIGGSSGAARTVTATLHGGHFTLFAELPRVLRVAELLEVLAALPKSAYRIKGFAHIEGEERPWVFQRVGTLPPQATPFALQGIKVPIGMVLIGPRLAAHEVEVKLAPLGAVLRR